VILFKALFSLVIFLFGLNVVFANETRDKHIRLVLNERTGAFSLFFLTDTERMRYEPFFNHRNPTASFITVSVDGRTYRPGRHRSFSTRVERIDGNPAIVFESPFLKITEVFSPVRTISSPFANGVSRTITIYNKSSEDAEIGLRVLIDTHLGEGRRRVPFATDIQSITGELIIDDTFDDKYWVSHGGRVSLMGNISSPYGMNIQRPDIIHFAPWKKLSDAPWRAVYHEGRSFSWFPYSINDSAVGYYYEPIVVTSRDFVEYTIFLTTEDAAWYLPPPVQNMRPPVAEIPEAVFDPQPEIEIEIETEMEELFEEEAAVEIPLEMETIIIEAARRTVPYEETAIEQAAQNNMDADMLTLRMFQDILDQFIAGEIELNEHDLLEIEMTVNRHTPHY
jgi:hypothetical protein